MGISYIPPEYFGVSGIGKSLGRIGDRQREDEETRRGIARETRREGFEDRQEQRAIDRTEREIKAADYTRTVSEEDQAIKRWNVMQEMAENAGPGDAGFSILQSAMEGLRVLNIVPTDFRLKRTREDIYADKETLAFATPADERTPEQWAFVAKRMGFEVGTTPEMLMQYNNNRLLEQGFNFKELQDSERKRTEYRAYLKGKGWTPGMMEGMIAELGVEDLRTGISLDEVRIEGIEAEMELNEQRRIQLGIDSNNEMQMLQMKLLEPFFKEYAEHGLDAMTAKRWAMGETLTTAEQDQILNVLESISREASGMSIGEQSKFMSDLLKLPDLDGNLRALSGAQLANNMFGAGVATVEEGTSMWTKKPTGQLELVVNVSLALARLLDSHQTGIPMSESTVTAKDSDVIDIQNVLNLAQERVSAINTADGLRAEIADLEGVTLEPGTEGFFIAKDAVLDMINKRAIELDVELSPAAPKYEDLSTGLITEEEAIREEESLRKTLHTGAMDREEMMGIRERLLELDEYRRANFGDIIDPLWPGAPRLAEKR
jgi:hypothetical protein